MESDSAKVSSNRLEQANWTHRQKCNRVEQTSDMAGFFTKENAAEMQRRAMVAITEAKRERQQRIAVIKQLEAGDKSFQVKTLGRVRCQIEELLDRMEKEDDPIRIDRLAAALARLETMERNLSMRQAPGTAKPSGKTEEQPASGEITPA